MEKTIHTPDGDIRLLLTQRQSEYYEGLKWLFTGGLATGRTYLLAVLFIETAVKNPGEMIRIFDHRSNHDVAEIKRMILRILPEWIIPYFYFGGNVICYTPKIKREFNQSVSEFTFKSVPELLKSDTTFIKVYPKGVESLSQAFIKQCYEESNIASISRTGNHIDIVLKNN